MKKLLYLTDQRALVINLHGKDWAIGREYAATDEGVRELSQWLLQQRWLSVSVLLDFADTSWTLQPLPPMPMFTRFRYLRALKIRLRQSSDRWRLVVVRGSNANRQSVIAHLNLQEAAGSISWCSVLDRHRFRLKAAYPALLLAGADPAVHKGAADMLLCGSCSDRHYWHQFYRHGVLQYVRILPLQKSTGAQLQQLRETLQYTQDEITGPAASPALVLTDLFATSAEELHQGLGRQLVSSVSRLEGSSAHLPLSDTQARLFDVLAARPQLLRDFRLSRSGAWPALGSSLARLFASTKALSSVAIVLLLVSMAGFAFCHSLNTTLAEGSDNAAQLSLANSLFPAPPQEMRNVVLLYEKLQADSVDPVVMLKNLAKGVTALPGLVLTRVEWLVDDQTAMLSSARLNTSLVAEHSRIIQVHNESQTLVLLRLTGYFTPDKGSVSQAYAQYRHLTQALSALPGVHLTDDQVPFDSAAINTAPRAGAENARAGFSVLIDYTGPGV